eukprot:1196014-Prorocentrum_minimum.AAC.6
MAILVHMGVKKVGTHFASARGKKHYCSRGAVGPQTLTAQRGVCTAAHPPVRDPGIPLLHKAYGPTIPYP